MDTLGGKWLEILKEAHPEAARVGFMYHPGAAPHARATPRSTGCNRSTLKTHLVPVPVRNAAEIEAGIAKLVSEQSEPVCLLRRTQ